MYCTRCGTQCSEGTRFCTSCGASTDPAQSSAPGAGNPAAPGFSSSSWSNTAASAPPRRLRRILADKKIAGVCAGFAEYFDMDVTLVRLIWAGLALLPPSPGVIIYVIAWIVLPTT
jgi:phage shock protein C